MNLTYNYSPNFELKKRKPDQIKFIIFHYTGMKKESDAIKRLTNIQSEVSSHYLIKNNGEIITLVPDLYVAWHAGKSIYEGIKDCNDYSIGIELEGCDDISFENIQYIKLSEIIITLIDNYKYLSEDRIVSHSDIAPGRKSDPGPLFDWKRLKTMIK